MSLPVAERGEKEYLNGAWSASSFDFEQTCRTYGRNDAFWVLCYRQHLAGDPLPDEKSARKLVRTANRATGGLNRQGDRERYTLYEAKQTIAQVSRYRGRGIQPLVARRRAARKISPQATRLLDAVCRVAEAAKCSTFYASHRQLGQMADLHHCQVAAFLYELERRKLVFRIGFTPAIEGRSRGTTILSLKPPKPLARVDERERPTWDPRKAQWTWTSPVAKGEISYATWRWLARRESSGAANVPYVYRYLFPLLNMNARHSSQVASAFLRTPDNPLRGSP